ncbi:MAG: hypothetical protein H7Y11_02935 [Armatimonadetes bacterium]|nr:hypothetical protein [Anaerolineae bacterium]
MRSTSPFFIGAVIGLALMAFALPGGEDAAQFYTRPWSAASNTPPWVHLVTAPLGWFGFPAAWALLIALTLLVMGWAARVWGAPWWVAILNPATFWVLWLGQIELFPIAGAALGWLVIQKRLHPLWMTVAYFCLLPKVQVGGGLMLLYTVWLWRDFGWRTLLRVAVLTGVLGVLSLLIWQDWVPLWITRLQRLVPIDDPYTFNSSITPWGLLLVPLALLPVQYGKQRRARIVAALTLLVSPYFAGYHCALLLTMARSPLTWLASALPLLPMLLASNRGTFWLIPVFVIAYELVTWRRDFNARTLPDVLEYSPR